MSYKQVYPERNRKEAIYYDSVKHYFVYLALYEDLSVAVVIFLLSF